MECVSHTGVTEDGAERTKRVFLDFLCRRVMHATVEASVFAATVLFNPRTDRCPASVASYSSPSTRFREFQIALPHHINCHMKPLFDKMNSAFRRARFAQGEVDGQRGGGSSAR